MTFCCAVVLASWGKLPDVTVESWCLAVALLCASVSEHESVSKQSKNPKKTKNKTEVTGSRSCGSDCVCHQDVVSLKTRSSHIGRFALQIRCRCLQVEGVALD